MKKILGLLLAVIFTIGTLVGCGGASSGETKSATAKARSCLLYTSLSLAEKSME